MKTNDKYGVSDRTAVGRVVRIFAVLFGFAALLLSCATPMPEQPEPEPAEEIDDVDDSLAGIIGRGDTEALERLFGLHVDLEQVDAEGRTPLHVAVIDGNHRAAVLLLQRGAEPDSRDPDRKTPLHYAVELGRASIVSVLVEHGASLFSEDQTGATPIETILDGPTELYEAAFTPATARRTDDHGRTPLHYASVAGRVSVVEHLLAVGASLTARDSSGATPLDAGLTNTERYEKARVAEVLIGRDAPLPRDEDFLFFYRTVASRNWNSRFADRATALHNAASGGHTGIVRLLNDRGAELDALDSSGRTALHHALANAHLPAAEVLLDAGAGASARDLDGNGVFHFALVSATPREAIEILIANRVNASLRNSGGDTALHRVVRLDTSSEFRSDLVRLLLSGGADVNVQNDEGTTALLDAVRRRDRSVAELLLAAGAGVFIENNAGDSPARAAFEFGSGVIEWFVDAAGVSLRDTDGNSLLHAAARDNRPDAVEYLLENGMTVSVRNGTGETPLHTAIRSRATDAAHALISAGANLYALNNEGRSPISFAFDHDREWRGRFFTADVLSIRDTADNTLLASAVTDGRTDSVQQLLDLGADVHARDRAGNTALHQAARLGEVEALRLLTVAGAQVATRDAQGNSPLHVIGPRDAERAIELLLTREAELESRNNEGRTPLHEAARRDDGDVVRVLLAHGASPDTRDSRGRTPLFDVVQAGHASTAVALIEAGAPVSARDFDGNTPLHVAVSESHGDLIRVGRSLGVDIFSENAQGQTALDIAFLHGGGRLEALVDRFNVNEQDNRGNTPLHRALLSNAPTEAIEYLVSLRGDLSIRNARGRTPIDIARENENATQIRLLEPAR